MGDQQNFAVLDWLIGEIEETLDEARQALEAYVEDPKDSTKIRFCLTHIHQVHGSLRMVEFHGPSLLAEEMEHLSQAIMNNRVSSNSDALEVLMRSLLQLPIYLDNVKIYRDDSATSILPLLNDIRAVRKEGFLSETNLFTPDLSSLEKVEGKRHGIFQDTQKLSEFLSKLREMYQFSAASVLRNLKVAENLSRIEKVFSQLKLMSSGTAANPLWTIALALVDALKNDDIELSVAVRGLLRNIARELRVLSDNAPSSFDAKPNINLIKNMLFYLASAETPSDKVAAIQKRFGVEDITLGKKGPAGSAMNAMDPDAVKSVVLALNEELNSIKSNLDGVLSGHLANEDLKEVVPIVKRVADTLAVLGISDLRSQMMAQSDALNDVSKRNDLDEDQLTQIASRIIEVEQKLDAIGKGVSNNRDIDNIDERKIEIDEAKIVVVRECQVGLEKVKDAIAEYLSSKWDVSHLNAVDTTLADIRGGLDMIPLVRPAAIIRTCGQFIQEKLVEGADKPESDTMMLLADAIAGVDYFLERITSDMSDDSSSYLGVAEDALLKLGYSVSDETKSAAVSDFNNVQYENDKEIIEKSNVQESIVPELITGLADSNMDDSTDNNVTSLFGGEANDDTQETDQSSEVEIEDSIELDLSPEAVEPEVTAETFVAGNEDRAVEEDEEDEVDDEIIEIFIEEAREVIQTLEEYVPQWLENVDDDDTRSTVRRAYHTLKGSGRMVSASNISELAWEVENMLNRVIDNTVDYVPEHGRIVNDVMKRLPELVNAFEAKAGNPCPDFTVAYATWAKQLSEGNIASDIFMSADTGQESEPADFVEPESLSDSVENQIDEPQISDEEQEDLVLREIFSSEAKTHLAAIQTFVDQMEHDAPIYSPPTNDLQRALHTLKGSAKMAQVIDIAKMAESLEAFAKELVTYQVPVTEDILQLIKDAHEYTETGLTSIESGSDANIPKLEQFLARAAELRELSVGHLVRLKELEENSEHPVDPRLLSIFMAEEMELLLEADTILKGWLASSQSENYHSLDETTDKIHELIAELSKLSLAAEQAKLPEMSSLSKQLMTAHQYILDGQVALNYDNVNVLCRGHIALLDMVDAIAAGQTLQVPAQDIINAVEALLSSYEPLQDDLTVDQDDTSIAEDVGSHDSDTIETSLEETSDNESSLFVGGAATAALVSGLAVSDLLSEKSSLSDTSDINLTNESDDSSDGSFNDNNEEVVLEPFGQNRVAEEEVEDEAVNFELDAGYEDDSEEIVLELTDEDQVDVPFNDVVEEIPVIGFEAEEIILESPDEENEEFDTETLSTETNEEIVIELLDDSQTSDIETVGSEELSSDNMSFDAVEPDNTSFENNPELTFEEPVEQNTTSLSDNTQVTDEEAVVEGLLDEIDRHSEDYDVDIIEVFIEEADEIVEDLDGAIHAWEDDSTNPEPLDEILRALHTLKGGARLAGFINLGELTHNYESHFIDVKPEEIDDRFFALVHSYQDQILSSIRGVKDFMATDLSRGLVGASVDNQMDTHHLDHTQISDVSRESSDQQSIDGQENSSNDEASDLVDRPQHAEQTSENLSNVVQFNAKQRSAESGFVMPQTAAANAQALSPNAKKSGPQELVKVPSELLEELVNLAGETSISRSRLEEQVSEFSYSIEEIDATLQRLQEQLRRLDKETEAQVLFRQEQMAQHEEFDPLEMDRYSHLQQLSRSLTESASDLIDLKTDLGEKLRDTETLLLQQSRINTTLQEGLMRSRMVPFSRLVPRLRRIVRQVAGELGKNVSFELDNIEGELDRTVLERMVPPFEHMLRNAVDHGLEAPEDRLASGKPESGRIVLTLGRDGGDVIIRLADDGRGVDLKRVRAKAIERELMSSTAELTDHDVMQFILHAGFSTAENITQISGRGVGMDVVNSEIKQLGGSVVINSEWGHGTEFVIRLPFTLSVNRALMVQVGSDNYAIPLSSIEGIVRVSPFELEHYYSNPDARFEYANENYQVRYLGAMLNHDARPNLDGHVLPLPVLLVRSAEHTMAMQVDALQGSREVVVKSLGPQFSAVQGLSGATVMGDGSVVVILDPNALVRQDIANADKLLAQATLLGTGTGSSIDIAPVETAKTVMVVDDSVTVRKVTTRFLEREGFDVITAKDGVDALNVLQDTMPDLMLLDIEMPRMDGFEVARNVRSTSRWSHLPIIMITSRTGEKHREHAYSLGVDNYLGKPYQEDILLDAIKQLIDARERLQS